EEMLATRATQAGVPIVYVNLVGGQDELVFDGASLVFDGDGRLLARSPQLEEDLLVVDVAVGPGRPLRLPEVHVRDAPPELPLPVARGVDEPLTPVAEVYQALVVGTRDYVRKNGFSDVLVALSGGIDSALVATIAVDALGAEHVVGVLMPSRF